MPESRPLSSLPLGFRALIIGSSGTIGSALMEEVQASGAGAVIGLHRTSEPAIQLEDEKSLARAAKWAEAQGPFQLIIDATGALTIDGRGPEKRLEALTAETLSRAFEINATGRALVLKHFIPLMPKYERALFGVLSARVGSIEDNHLGGWYGYRASKAAGNMLLQCAAIEAHRTRPQAVFAALQPGTVASRLSSPFNSGHALTDPLESARGLLWALDRLHAKGRAWFVDYRGEEIPW